MCLQKLQVCVFFFLNYVGTLILNGTLLKAATQQIKYKVQKGVSSCDDVGSSNHCWASREDLCVVCQLYNTGRLKAALFVIVALSEIDPRCITGCPSPDQSRLLFAFCK